MVTMNLWKTVPGICGEIPTLHEGKGYADFFNNNGITAFVVNYRVLPHRFPLPLLDSRRCIFIRMVIMD